MNESYQVTLHYFDPNDNYWKTESTIVYGYKNKTSHKQAGLDAARDWTKKGYKLVEVKRVDYV